MLQGSPMFIRRIHDVGIETVIGRVFKDGHGLTAVAVVGVGGRLFLRGAHTEVTSCRRAAAERVSDRERWRDRELWVILFAINVIIHQVSSKARSNFGGVNCRPSVARTAFSL